MYEEKGCRGTGSLFFCAECDPSVNTTLALVHTLADGDRDFSFYRKPGADLMLTENEIDKRMIEKCRVFHFGSLSLTE